MKLKVTVNGVAYDIEVEVEEQDIRPKSLLLGAATHHSTAPTTASVSGASSNAVTAPLAGSVARVLVSEGENIEAGQVLLVLEAMKMETEITAPAAGKVSAILVAPGDAVQGGQPLVEL
ncbi:MAG: acetyl-CoA carboxylase biotin carboxyl carrier protein subunit [Propionibacterium sp.]|nr:MAG: acetyl-CoA carboxylase biotin carboxyl carrier protein subunit [Propionibacterium sp.]